MLDVPLARLRSPPWPDSETSTNQRLSYDDTRSVYHSHAAAPGVVTRFRRRLQGPARPSTDFPDLPLLRGLAGPTIVSSRAVAPRMPRLTTSRLNVDKGPDLGFWIFE
ncbi:MAG: hypothetical protein ACI9MR_002152 [Myxococcota bacterium]|jgi:hypothetical protein